MDKETIDIVNGGESALIEIMDKYSYALLRYCHNILCDYHEAQDALQVTFIKAYQKRKTYNDKMSLSPWLYKIAYTTCVDILRRRKPTETIGEYAKQEQGEYIPEEILNALLQLNALDRAIVYGRVMEELSYERLSRIHHKSPAALRKRYERAKKRLAESLQDNYPEYAHNPNAALNEEELT